ncbi:hypothetical protein BJX61DRAFT_456524 [Aspergillus egyptiacus]|nr:hypothetical protein BJX61DRAFT_456524 [Aspergillus egyptiacus]
MPEDTNASTNANANANAKEAFMDRMFRRRPSVGEDKSQLPAFERRGSIEEATAIPERAESVEEHRPHHQRRDSRLQRFKDMMQSEEELDEAGKIYAKLM